MVLRVAVIGAGAAGLSALRHLTARPDTFRPVAFEQASSVGGTWVYTDKVGKDDRGLPIHASMYTNLRTNLPKEVMAFPDFPFSKCPESFVTHEQVLQYLVDYAEHFNLMDFIQFDTVVENVEPSAADGKTTWTVKTKSVTSCETDQQEFDAVMVCNGHYAVPLVPALPGLASFRGRLSHSHDYRRPEAFAGARVVLLGAASSGQDIALDIAACAQTVTLCHRKAPLQSSLPTNVTQECGIREVVADGVVLESGRHLAADALLLCTGYRYTFPFLASRSPCAPAVTDERVWPLYKHVIHARYPTLSFLGICKHVSPFPQFDCQARFVLAALAGEMALPSPEDMERDIGLDYEGRLADGMPPRHAHTMGPRQWAYNDMLAALAGFAPLPAVVADLYEHVHGTRTTMLTSYKRLRFEVVSESEFKVIPGQ